MSEDKKPKARTLSLSERDKLPAYVYFRTPGAWGGGTPEQMLAQGEVYEALGLAVLEKKLAGKDSVNMLAMGTTTAPVKLSPGAVEVLRRILSVQGQSTALALVSISLLKRIDGA